MARNWKEQLEEVGVSEDIIEYGGLRANGKDKVEYPCQYPPRINYDSEGANDIIYHTVYRWRRLPDSVESARKAGRKTQRFGNPDVEDLPDGEMPMIYTPNFSRLRSEVQAAGGVLKLYEGDKDTWTSWAAGFMNSAGLFAASSHIDHRLIEILKELNVKHVDFYPDGDFAGLSAAEKMLDLFDGSPISLKIKAMRMFVDDVRTKDTSDIWLAVGQDPKRHRAILSGLSDMKLATKRQRELAQSSEYFIPGLYEQIEAEFAARTKSGSVDFSNYGWSKEAIACPFHDHEHDDTSPAFHWHSKKKFGFCHKRGEQFLAKDLADAFGIKWQDYVNNTHSKSAPPSVKTPDAQIQSEKDKKSEASPTMLNLGTSHLNQILPLVEQYDQMPDSSLIVSLDDAMRNFELRYEGQLFPEYPPVEMPVEIFHQLGGMGRVIQRPAMIGLLGMSGGFKCQKYDTRIQTEKGLVQIGSFACDGDEKVKSMNVNVMSKNGIRQTSHFHDTGVAPTKLIVTRFGYENQGTYNHPLLVLGDDGKFVWKRLDAIKVGDYVCIHRKPSMFGDVTKLPEFSSSMVTNTVAYNLPESLDVETAYVLGALTGDGGLTHRPSVNFTSKDAEPLEALVAWAENHGMKVVHRDRHDYSIHSAYLLDWLNNLGLHGYSYEKSVPECIYSAPKPMVKAYLQGLFDTDGYAASKDKFRVSLTTTSKELAKGVQQLLLMFGIVSRRFAVESKAGHRTSYRVLMRGTEAMRYFEEVGFRLTRKQEVVNDAPATFNTNVDIVPYLPEVDFSKLSGNRGERGKLRRDLRRVYSNSKAYHSMSYSRLEQYREYYPEFHDILDKQYFFDPVVSVEEGGEEQCYDLTVPDGASFIANGFVSHNTSMLTWIVNKLALKGYNVIVWSPEWSPERNADRIVQQFGGLPMWQMALYERYHWEQEMIKRGEIEQTDDALFGHKPSNMTDAKTRFAVNKIRKTFRGKIVYLKDFAPSIYHLAAQVLSVHRRMTESGHQPEVWIVDYAQMASAPAEVRRYWSMEDTVTVLKNVTLLKGFATFVSSQVRKSDAEAVMARKGYLGSTSGLNFRDQQFNFFWTISPVPEMDDKGTVVLANGQRRRVLKIAVVKNSLGKTANDEHNLIKLYVDPKRMVLSDTPEGDMSDSSFQMSIVDDDPDLTGGDDEPEGGEGLTKIVDQDEFDEAYPVDDSDSDDEVDVKQLEL